MKRPHWLTIAAAGTLLTAMVTALAVPPERVQGDLARILFVHVPSAWLAYLSFAVTLLGSAMYLIRKDLRWDRLAGASAEVGVFFTGLTLALGMIWGKPTWGVWWTWDARLVLTAVMFFVYLGYLAVRRSIEDPELRARRSAVLGIIAVLQIPIVHFSVTWWRGLHQPPTVLRPDNPQIDSPLLFALLMAVAAFTVVFAALVARRTELATLEDEFIQPALEEATAGADITAPKLGGGAT